MSTCIGLWTAKTQKSERKSLVLNKKHCKLCLNCVVGTSLYNVSSLSCQFTASGRRSNGVKLWYCLTKQPVCVSKGEVLAFKLVPGMRVNPTAFPKSRDCCWIPSPNFGRDMTAPGLFYISTLIIAVMLWFKLVKVRWDQDLLKHCSNTILLFAYAEKRWPSRLGATFSNWEGIKSISWNSTREFGSLAQLETSESWSSIVKAAYCFKPEVLIFPSHLHAEFAVV